MKGKNMKIKLRNKFGSGAVFDFDWKITIIDKTKRPYRKKTLTRTDIIGNDMKHAVSTIDDYIEYHHCVGGGIYSER
tara:strand:- start:117 stop:347 length:231 start_codon:yes stop_codon:yes gene_type:complete